LSSVEREELDFCQKPNQNSFFGDVNGSKFDLISKEDRSSKKPERVILESTGNIAKRIIAFKRQVLLPLIESV